MLPGPTSYAAPRVRGYRLSASTVYDNQEKAADAIQKLEDIRTTVVALSTPDANGKTKLDAEDAAAIIEAVNAAEACINAEATPVA